MDIWHRIGRVIRLSNLGTFLFFILNVGLLYLILYFAETTKEELLAITVIYVSFFVIGLSPIGDFVLSLSLGARKIKRTDQIIKIHPLFEVVYEKAKKKTSYISKRIKLKIIPNDDTVNAFAVGRRTICITQGLLNLDDESIMAVLAHEFGHIAYKHTLIQVLALCSNMLVSIVLLFVKVISWIIAGISSIISLFYRSYLFAFLTTASAAITSFAIWLWTKFCLLFLRWSMRENEYLADEYALMLGYGNSLASVIDNCFCSEPSNKFFKVLYSTHPSNDSRIAHLQELGSIYNAFIE